MSAFFAFAESHPMWALIYLMTVCVTIAGCTGYIAEAVSIKRILK